MKKLSFLAGVALLAACGQTKEAPTTPETPEAAPKVETCTYQVGDSTTVHWTSYKHTAKVGVHGVFDQVEVNSPAGEFPVNEGATVKVLTNSVNSNDTLRDGKLKRTLFGTITNGTEVSGVVTKAAADGGTIALSMNDTTLNVDYTLELKEKALDLKFGVTMDAFGANEAMDALNEVCAAKHTGGDGVNKLWSEIDIIVSTQVTKTCK